ncbi:uncharacterized protein BDR25DRAFT_351582 [Lindgomyces ingoldianus]|uniref:Uncharacterized protein n=1 Tax=Lindgomyces ingoldianus TaxID=673940 RepID=A0ACB6R6V2_9PLEO|nr:uncharacterized protein BDR25DRAFT_351582 [Lindgomyces ingoldianus]KAF2474050.1 hypothetical protein BDR25DRAFT_351582 [Lindgomyces ingoldianus]
MNSHRSILHTKRKVRRLHSKRKTKQLDSLFSNGPYHQPFEEDSPYVQSKRNSMKLEGPEACEDNLDIFLQGCEGNVPSSAIEDVKEFCIGTSSKEAKIWLDDREKYTGLSREYVSRLTAEDLKDALALRQFGLGDIPDADRRLIHLVVLEPSKWTGIVPIPLPPKPQFSSKGKDSKLTPNSYIPDLDPATSAHWPRLHLAIKCPYYETLFGSTLPSKLRSVWIFRYVETFGILTPKIIDCELFGLFHLSYLALRLHHTPSQNAPAPGAHNTRSRERIDVSFLNIAHGVGATYPKNATGVETICIVSLLYLLKWEQISTGLMWCLGSRTSRLRIIQTMQLLRKLWGRLSITIRAWEKFIAPTGHSRHFDTSKLSLKKNLDKINKMFEQLESSKILTMRLNLESKDLSYQSHPLHHEIISLNREAQKMSMENNRTNQLTTPLVVVTAYFGTQQSIFTFDQNPKTFVVCILVLLLMLKLCNLAILLARRPRWLTQFPDSKTLTDINP